MTAVQSEDYSGKERRGKPRLFGQFPARVRGVDANGEAFEIDVLVDSVSATGLYFRLPHSVAPGTRLFIMVRLPGGTGSNPSGPVVAAYCDVVRSESHGDGLCGMGVSLKRHKLL